VDQGLSRRGEFKSPRSLCNTLLLALLLVVSVNVGCRRSATSVSGITVREQISPQPVRTGPATVAIQLADQKTQPIPHAAITIEGDMSHPGMAPTFSKAEEIAPGKYQARLDFNMGGDWAVLLHIQLANGQKIERQIDVRGVQAN
jgi:YtkA-like